eukprot:11406300-Heterocapsa_arctica.AAC.1
MVQEYAEQVPILDEDYEENYDQNYEENYDENYEENFGQQKCEPEDRRQDEDDYYGVVLTIQPADEDRRREDRGHASISEDEPEAEVGG